MGHSLYTETKGGVVDVGEVRGAGRAAGKRRVDRKRGRRGHFVFPFRMAFMV